MSHLAMLKSAPHRTLSAVLQVLPQHGVGALVTRDTWHPLGGRFWEIVQVASRKDDLTKLDAWGHFYKHGVKQNYIPRRIASVWKFGWMWKLRPEEAAALQPQIQRFEQLLEAGVIPQPPPIILKASPAAAAAAAGKRVA